MQPNASNAKKTKQLKLVGLLLGGLVIAILTQPSDENQTQAPAKVTAVKLAPAPVAAKPKTSELSDELTSITELPRTEISSIVNQTLFYSPPPEIESPAADQAELVIEQEVVPIVVKAVYGSAQGASRKALIDNDVISAGEALPDGRVILGVSSDGVELSK